MGKIMDTYYKTVDAWSRLLEKVEAYISAEEELDEELFTDAMKGAFDIYDKMYCLETIKVQDCNELGANHLLFLTGVLSEYAAERYITDEDSELFRASQLAVRLVLGRITNNYIWHADGIFPAIELEYIFDSDRELVYDVNKGDLSDLVEVWRLTF